MRRWPNDLILALDQGTTSTRAILFDRAGQPLAEASRPLRQSYPRARLGRARRRGDLAPPAWRAARGDERSPGAPKTWPRSASPTNARRW
ncbi:FGGY family carbohydrate kinase [Caulobacter segnis]